MRLSTGGRDLPPVNFQQQFDKRLRRRRQRAVAPDRQPEVAFDRESIHLNNRQFAKCQLPLHGERREERGAEATENRLFDGLIAAEARGDTQQLRFETDLAQGQVDGTATP